MHKSATKCNETVYKQAWSIKNYRYVGDVSVARSQARATERAVSTGSAAYWERATADGVLDRLLHLQGPCPEALRSPVAPSGRESRSMSSSRDARGMVAHPATDGSGRSVSSGRGDEGSC
jgi:hypothetical protein